MVGCCAGGCATCKTAGGLRGGSRSQTCVDWQCGGGGWSIAGGLGADVAKPRCGRHVARFRFQQGRMCKHASLQRPWRLRCPRTGTRGCHRVGIWNAHAYRIAPGTRHRQSKRVRCRRCDRCQPAPVVLRGQKQTITPVRSCGLDTRCDWPDELKITTSTRGGSSLRTDADAPPPTVRVHRLFFFQLLHLGPHYACPHHHPPCTEHLLGRRVFPDRPLSASMIPF